MRDSLRGVQVIQQPCREGDRVGELPHHGLLDDRQRQPAAAAASSGASFERQSQRNLATLFERNPCTALLLEDEGITIDPPLDSVSLR